VTGHVLRLTAYCLAVFAIAVTAMWAASLLPISNSVGAWAACAGAGCFATVAATTWLPCPERRKDRP
jgi:hypothetical protein